MPSLPLTGFSSNDEIWTVYGIALGLSLLLSLQICFSLKVEQLFIQFLLGKNKRGLWARERASIKSWNDQVRKYCSDNDLSIVLHQRIKYPTTMADFVDNFMS